MSKRLPFVITSVAVHEQMIECGCVTGNQNHRLMVMCVRALHPAAGP